MLHGISTSTLTSAHAISALTSSFFVSISLRCERITQLLNILNQLLLFSQNKDYELRYIYIYVTWFYFPYFVLKGIGDMLRNKFLVTFSNGTKDACKQLNKFVTISSLLVTY